ncbi:MAG: TIGR04086 family membrane protein [Clostridia bacterium]|nr:TIGR04086 family membrane protein [Clostridia bacterium]
MNIGDKTLETVEHKNVFCIIKGSAIAIIFTVILLIGFALLLAYTSMPENTITPVIIAICGISVVIGSIVSSKKIKKQGLINGSAVGLIYISVIYLLSSIVEGDFGVNLTSIIMMIVTVTFGALGGIIGVNLKRK